MIRKNPYTEEKYNHYRATESAPLLEWLLANLKESKSKVKATLQNRGIKVNGKCVTQFDHPLKVGDKISVSKSKKNDLFRSRYVKIVYEEYRYSFNGCWPLFIECEDSSRRLFS